MSEFEEQRNLIKLYSTYVSRPKSSFFRDVGLAVVQDERKGIYLHSLAGPRRKGKKLEMIDARTSGGVFNLGHINPEMIQSLKDALNNGIDIGDHHMISKHRSQLAEKLAELLPGEINQTQYSVGGGEAIDLAIKLAWAATKRKKVISAIGGYHGVTGLALAAGDPKFRDPFLWDLPFFKSVEFGNIEALQKEIDEETACVIFETIPATGGIQIAPEGYFQQVRELCDKVGAIMIADEVQTALGRIGTIVGIYGGLYPNELVIPDIIVLAKGMSGGIYPMACTCYKPFLGEVFNIDPFLHISTTGGSELGCIVSLKMLEIQSNPEFLSHVQKMGTILSKGLIKLKEDFSSLITDVRGRGLMWGIEFINDRYGMGYTLSMIKNGVFADYCGNDKKTIKLMPPLIITEEEVIELLNRLRIALKELPLPST